VSVKHNNNKYKTYNVIAGLRVSTLTESSSGPHDADPYKESTMHCEIPNAHNICSEWQWEWLTMRTCMLCSNKMLSNTEWNIRWVIIYAWCLWSLVKVGGQVQGGGEGGLACYVFALQFVLGFLGDTHIYIYVWLCVYVCVCVCACMHVRVLVHVHVKEKCFLSDILCAWIQIMA